MLWRRKKFLYPPFKRICIHFVNFFMQRNKISRKTFCLRYEKKKKRKKKQTRKRNPRTLDKDRNALFHLHIPPKIYIHWRSAMYNRGWEGTSKKGLPIVRRVGLLGASFIKILIRYTPFKLQINAGNWIRLMRGQLWGRGREGEGRVFCPKEAYKGGSGPNCPTNIFHRRNICWQTKPNYG